MMVPDPVMSGRWSVEAIGGVIRDVNRLMVWPIPAAHMVGRDITLTIIGAVSAAVADIIVPRRRIGAMGARRRAVNRPRRWPVIRPLGMMALIVIAIIGMTIVVAAIATIVVAAMIIVTASTVSVVAVSATMAAIMITAAAIVIAASAFRIGGGCGQQAQRGRGGDQGSKGLEQFHGGQSLRLGARTDASAQANQIPHPAGL
eukprot:TRINITY_DN15175_c0_g1_i1.p2 TRINITY_DN15175_c0_g1~~TRINITY_DN15175_c0_g1_i1.p2  ORF type:complete len:202 (-),score=5.98 TRINITY_DN15175_c0_g1_i1:74-679(-)